MNKSRYLYVFEILKQIKGFSLYLIISSIVRVLSKLSSIVIFILSVLVIQKLLTGSYDMPDNMIIYMLIMVTAIILISYLDTYVSHDMSFRILGKLREKTYDKLDEIAPGGIEGKSTADFITTIVSDINVFEWFYAHVLIEWIGTIVTVIVLSCVLFAHSPIVFIITLITLFTLIIIPQLSVSQSEEKGFTLKRLFGQLNSIIADGIFGIRDILGYHFEKSFFEKLQNGTEEYSHYLYQYSKRSTNEKISFDFIGNLSLIISIVFLFFTQNDASNIILIFSLSLSIISCVQETLSEGTNYGFVFGAAKRVFGVLNLKEPVLNNGYILSDNKKFICGALHISFENVCFSYPSNKNKQILDNINFNIQPNEITTIVGASGSGKSTIAKLLQRFWDVDDGKISINSVELKRIKLEELRKLVTVVSQESYLFNGTIEDNFKLVRQDLTLEKIQAVAKKAQADKFITKLPDGYQTQVGQNGTFLSGGEKQRISLTQALLLNSPILILDEASSALDTKNEQLINNTLNEIKYEKTIIVIAHRLSTIKKSDKIIFLENGKVNQIGTYAELIDKNKNFTKVVRGKDFE